VIEGERQHISTTSPGVVVERGSNPQLEWFDGPEVALNWLFPYPILPPARGATTSHYEVPLPYLKTRLKSPLNRVALPRQALDVIFRDDCHHSLVGAAFVASLVAEALECCILNSTHTATPPLVRPLPPVMDASHWTGGQGAWD
jgi:hypothetical protein